ncbi:MFS transporter [Paenibacillus sp. LS1]|uniref:MFS transporter n=1 Tax=Paenibacillus sp. LS1 TaxID=2992120 RepID=UPI0022308214|nr:MFS transporter [Paenibacillus sp. LS1]MCW3796032.1 MFS transporter [Paenibacillus sp. LS1]
MLIGQIITLFGSAILRFALSLYILDFTGSAETFAVLLAVSTLPTILLSPIGGAIADRVNRKHLIVSFDFISFVVTGGLLAFLYAGSGDMVIIIGAVMTILALVSTFYHPTVQASIPLLVEEDKLMKANGAVSGIGAITNFAGPVLGGLIYGFAGIEFIVAVTCASFLIAAIIELFIRIPFFKEARVQGMLKTIGSDLAIGFRYIHKENPFLLKIIMIAALINLFITPLFLVGIPYVIKVLMHMEDQYFGYTQGGISLSMIVAAAVIGFVAGKIRINNLYLYFLGSGIIFLPMAFAIYPSWLGGDQQPIIAYLVFSLCAMLIMFVITLVNIFFTTLLQKKTPNALLGKVMAILFAISTCAVPIGQVVTGTLIDKFTNNMYILVILIGMITIIISLVMKKLLSSSSENSTTQDTVTTQV